MNNMKITKEDLINKIETLNGYVEYLSKYEPLETLYPNLVVEVKEWIEEVRKNKIEFSE